MFLREHTEPVSILEGAGAAFVSAAARIGVTTVADLVALYPRDYLDRRRAVSLTEAAGLKTAVVVLSVLEHQWVGFGRRRTLRIVASDGSTRASLLCFNRGFLARTLPPGAKLFVHGSFVPGRLGLESSSFELEPWSENPRSFLRILPVYPLTRGLTQATLRRIVSQALSKVLPDLENELPEPVIRAAGLLGKARALEAVHFPREPSDVERARRALKYEELFHLHLAVSRRSSKAAALSGARGRAGARRRGTRLRDELVARLPFELTGDQLRAVHEIEGDLRGGRPMMRLLQGDVGCGKTLVALLGCLSVIEAGEQAALMAPTELLARQHAESASRLLEPLGVRVAFLTSGVSGPARALLLEALSHGGKGDVDLLVGTHALFSEEVRFRRLGFVVIDEQHRFGVAQRKELVAKGAAPDVLLMTATPIPRTLALTVFGDLEVSEIREMPVGRKPVITHLAREGNETKVYERVRLELRRGRQAYFVYPLIEESEVLGLKDAERMFARLHEEIYPEWPCVLIHSRLPEEEKVKRMAQFTAGEARVLVATSVVEVGVDVANATCMVVEHADRFGLSALHQLRGRVGRAGHQSYAFLVFSPELTEAGTERLRIMKDTVDGFRIAEEDLRLRGPGSIMGLEQAGYLKLGLADLSTDLELVVETREAVRAQAGGDPGLLLPENAVLRALLARAPPFDELALAGG